MTELHPNAQRVVDAAAVAGVPIEVVEHLAATRIAAVAGHPDMCAESAQPTY